MLNRILKIAISLTVCLPVVTTAQVDTSQWKCELCPFEDGYKADLDIGATYVSDSAARFGSSTGLDEEGAYAKIGGEGRYAADGFQLRWAARELALDSRDFAVEAGRQGSYGIHVSYDEFPYRLFDTTSTVYMATGGSTLNLPAGWVAAGTTSGMTGLSTSQRPLNIGSDRQTFGVGGFLLPSENFKVFADYRQQGREGIDIVAGSNFTQASLLPRFIDHQTDTVNLGVRYVNGPFNVAIAWYGSFFENKAKSLTWDNAFFDDPLTSGFEPGRQAVEPGNDFQQFSISGTYRLDAMNTLIAFGAASGRGEQNEPLLAYTVNPGIAANALPRANLDGKVDTGSYSLTLTSRPIPKGRLNLAYRYDDRDNRTARDSWSRVIVDALQSGEVELNTPYSFERARLSANGDYRILDNLRLSAGYDRTDLDRDFQEVAEQSEDSGWGSAKWRPLNWLNLSAKGGSARREINRYDESVAASLGQNPLLRKYNLAHRYREFGELAISASPADKPYSVGLTAFFADDSYSQSQLGLTSSENIHFSVDLSWTVSETASVYLLGGLETIDANQAGSASFSSPDWFAIHEDSFSHYGGGMELRNVGEKTKITLDYSHTDGETAISTGGSALSMSQFPDLESTLDSLRLMVNYEKSERLGINLGFRYESFSTRDWAIAGVEAGTIPSILSLGAKPYDYDVWVVSLSFRYIIGERDISFSE
jgi:MtrB/PioB family decaheme-associated outer membrane protein